MSDIKVKITQVSYGRTLNVGNYETVRLDLTAQVADDQKWIDVLNELRRKLEALEPKIREQGH
jgi:hypothetical protein